jgi:hypothetical protein
MIDGIHDDGLQRRKPVGKRRRSRLENQRRFDLVQRAVGKSKRRRDRLP